MVLHFTPCSCLYSAIRVAPTHKDPASRCSDREWLLLPNSVRMTLSFTILLFPLPIQSSVSIVTGYGLDDQGEQEFESR
jgi:hypothetical protein